MVSFCVYGRNYLSYKFSQFIISSPVGLPTSQLASFLLVSQKRTFPVKLVRKFSFHIFAFAVNSVDNAGVIATLAIG